VSEKETTLAGVVSGMLTVPDAWVTFATCYLAALEETAAKKARSRGASSRAKALADWHAMLLDQFAGTPEEGLLDRIAACPGLAGPELTFFQARLAESRGQTDRARALILRALDELPGDLDFLAFARDIGATLPPRIQQIADERARFLT
jgi:hypothetical protein